MTSPTSTTRSPARAIENVWDYPRPPRLERTARLLEVKWYDSRGGPATMIASTRGAYRVLETSHPPTYYLPPSAISPDVKLTKESKSTFCEWKGSASYWTLSLPNLPSSPTVKSRIWSYASPTPSFAPIKDCLSFYASDGTGCGQLSQAGGWKCFVDGKEVKAQPGDFYGGWISSNEAGGEKGFKGGERDRWLAA